MAFRLVLAVALSAVGVYWMAAACYELVAARKPPGIFGVGLLRRVDPEPVLTTTQWRAGGAFLAFLASALLLVAARLFQGWWF